MEEPRMADQKEENQKEKDGKSKEVGRKEKEKGKETIQVILPTKQGYVTKGKEGDGQEMRNNDHNGGMGLNYEQQNTQGGGVTNKGIQP